MNALGTIRAMAPLFGRDQQLDAISRILTNAQTGHGGALLFRGVAGVGKSALLERSVADAVANAFDVRIATGVPIETALPYGVLSTLFARELHHEQLRRVPSLAAAIGQKTVPEPPSVMEVAAEALQLLSESGKQRPLLIVIDDAQWADRSSSTVIGHIARHSVADRIAVLIGMRVQLSQNDHVRHTNRPLTPRPVRSVGIAQLPDPFAGVSAIDLLPLEPKDTYTALLAAGCPPDEADQWIIRCGGLPLAIVEIGRRGLFQSSDADDVAEFLPTAYLDLVASLPSEVVEAALYGAVCADLPVLRSIGLPDLTDRLHAGAKAGLLNFLTSASDERVMFRHPLLVAAVLAHAGREKERSVHRKVAAAMAANGSHDRAAIHLAAAAEGTDAEACDALRQMARRALARGALTESANAALRAANFSADPDEKSVLLTLAADAHFDSGDAEAAFRAINTSIGIAVAPQIKADAQSLRARMSMWLISPADSVRQLDDVAASMRTVDPGRAAWALAAASHIGYLAGDLSSAIARATEAELLAVDAGDVATAVAAAAAVAWNNFLAGDITEFDQRVAPFEPLMRQQLAERTWAGVHLGELFCITWICSERWDEAEALARSLVHTTKSMGARLSAASSSLMLGSICWRRGRWDEAYAVERPLLDEGETPPITLAWMQALVAQLTSTMGLVDETRHLVTSALPVATASDVFFVIATANAALGHLELSLGNTDEALALLDRAAAAMGRVQIREPGYVLFQGDHLEALLQAGRSDEAQQRLVELTKFSDDYGRQWTKGIGLRIRAQLSADRATANQLFDDAIWVFDTLGMPFEVARTLLSRGGKQDCADARRMFLHLGASVWADAAVARSGNGTRPSVGTPANRSDEPTERPRVLDLLAPSERNVALAVLSGRTNREIAAELYLSAKTVDHYLQSAFRKLGVRNRTELATILSRELSAPSSTVSPRVASRTVPPRTVRRRTAESRGET
jgi:DNA-binding NarL/FixJ family response regulator